MIKAYTKTHEDDQKVVYQFNAISLWFLYISVALMISGLLHPLLYLFGAILLSTYFLLVSLPALKINREINKYAKHMGVKVIGSKWSFSNPLQFTLTKQTK